MLIVELKVTLKVIFPILISISLVWLIYLVPEILSIVHILSFEEIKIVCIAQNLHFLRFNNTVLKSNISLRFKNWQLFFD